MKKDDSKHEVLRALAMFSQIGITMFVTIAVSFFVGHFIDGWLGTSPIFLLIFIAIGVIAAIRNMFHLLSRLYKK